MADKNIKLNAQEIEIITEGLNKQQESLRRVADRWKGNAEVMKVFGHNIQAIQTLRERINL